MTYDFNVREVSIYPRVRPLKVERKFIAVSNHLASFDRLDEH